MTTLASEMDETRRTAVADPATTATEATEPAAFAAAAYRAHANVIYRSLARACGNAEDAEEAVQDAFLKLHQAVGDGQTIRHVRAWTFRVAHNELLKRIDKRAYEQTAWARVGALLTRRAARRSPDQHVLQQQVLDAARRLPLRQRVIILARLDGWRFREIGEALDKTPAQTAKLYERALTTLRREIGEFTR